MKLSTITIAITLTASLLCASPSFANSHKAGQRGDNGIVRVLSQLGLSETQKADIRLIMAQAKADASIMRQGAKVSQEQVRTLMSQDEWDASLAAQIVQERLTQRSSRQFARANAMHQAYAILTDTQKDALENKASMREGQRGKRKEQSLSMLNNPRLQKSLALSAEQITDIQSIVTDVKSENESLRSSIRQFKQAEKALIQSEDFSREAWDALFLDAKATMATMRVNQLNARYNIKNILTAEQITTLESMPKRKKAKMKDRFKQV